MTSSSSELLLHFAASCMDQGHCIYPWCPLSHWLSWFEPCRWRWRGMGSRATQWPHHRCHSIMPRMFHNPVHWLSTAWAVPHTGKGVHKGRKALLQWDTGVCVQWAHRHPQSQHPWLSITTASA